LPLKHTHDKDKNRGNRSLEASDGLSQYSHFSVNLCSYAEVHMRVEIASWRFSGTYFPA